MSGRDRTSTVEQALHWIFDSRTTGRVTIVQAPNIWLWIFLAGLIGEQLAPENGPSRPALGGAKAAGLTIWALAEVFRGVNPWRRCLGVAALVYETATWRLH